MQYEVVAVGEQDLPQGTHWLTVEQPAGPPLLIINGAPARCWDFMQATQDLREPCTEPTLLLPERPLLYAV